VPLPAGELLIAAAVYAAHTHRLDIAVLAAGAAIMALVGGLIGYGVGRSVGAASLARHGAAIGLGPSRLRLGQYLFLAHGGKIVFFLRFIALLSPFGGLLAGVNRMPWVRFVVVNALGGATWAVTMAGGGYLFGALFASVGRPVGFAALALAALLAVVAFIYVHRQGATLQAKADAMLPGEGGG
jgi:membrane protein DedA with SNARE-associated domain